MKRVLRKIRDICFPKKWTYVSYNQLVIDVNSFIRKLPKTDLVLGIERSGEMVGLLIALKLGLPFATPENYLKGRISYSHFDKQKRTFNNILLVDDSISSGKTLEKYVSLLKNKKIDFQTAIVYVTNEPKEKIDFYYKIIKHPRFFEWNMLFKIYGKTGFDMDGVITENCPIGFDNNEDLYVKWIKTAKPYLIPNFKIEVIASNRLEKYRTETEKWLKDHDVEYSKLVLWNLENKEDRKNWGETKVNAVKEFKLEFFFESNFEQAKAIKKDCGIPVFCSDEGVLL